MSKDVAHMIWELAKKDSAFDGLTLKQMYSKRLAMDKNEIKKKLFNLVSNHIQNEKPLKTFIILDPSHEIIGSSTTTKRHLLRDSRFITNHMFVYEHEGVVIEVTNPESKFLIEYGIIQLDLKWKVTKQNEDHNSMIISWDHWK